MNNYNSFNPMMNNVNFTSQSFLPPIKQEKIPDPDTLTSVLNPFRLIMPHKIYDEDLMDTHESGSHCQEKDNHVELCNDPNCKPVEDCSKCNSSKEMTKDNLSKSKKTGE